MTRAAPPLPASGPAADALASAHARLLQTRGFQFDFPQLQQTPASPFSKALGAWLKSMFGGLKGAGPAVSWVLWGALALGVVALLVTIGRAWLTSQTERASRLALSASGLAPPPAVSRALLAEADALAGEGRFGEAVHLILLRTLEELNLRRPALIRPALTSREIAALAAVPEPVRAPLSRIAQAGEMHLFAGRPTPEAAFISARVDYARFLDAAAQA